MNQKLAKLNASQAAEQCLDQMLQTINTDYSGGRITKTQLLSWIVIYFEKMLPAKIQLIRNEHFDAVTHLENLIKQAKHAKRQGTPDTHMTQMLATLSHQLKPTSKRVNMRVKQHGRLPIEKDLQLNDNDHID